MYIIGKRQSGCKAFYDLEFRDNTGMQVSGLIKHVFPYKNAMSVHYIAD